MKNFLFRTFLLFIFISVSSVSAFDIEKTNEGDLPSGTTNEGLSGNSEVLPGDTQKFKNIYNEIIAEAIPLNSSPNIILGNSEIDTEIRKVVQIKDLELNSLSGLNVNNNIISFYFSNPNKNRINSIILNTTGGTQTFTLNKFIREGQFAIHILEGKYLNLTFNGEKILTRKINLISGNYNSIKLSFGKKLFIKNYKLYYTGIDYLKEQNKKILSVTTNGDFIKNNISKTITNKSNLNNLKLKKTFTWNKENKKFEIKEEINSKKDIIISIPTELKSYLKIDSTPLSILNDLTNTLDNTNFEQVIEIDGDINTKEFLLKLSPSNEYFLGRIKIIKTTSGTEDTYKIDITKLYKGSLNLNNLQSIELDGDTTTKEFYLENGIYTYIYQYKNGNFIKLMGEKYIKVYFGNLLTKNGTSWKVLFSLSTQEVADGGKYYVVPLFKLYWFDGNKNIYFMKQTRDFTDFETFKLKIDGNYIYFKEAGIVNKSLTNYIN